MADCGLVWFRRDLRIDDNPAWAAATSAHSEVVALFVVDPVLIAASGPHRLRQLLASVVALDRELQVRGGVLRVRRGDPARIVVEEAASAGAEGVHWNEDVTPYAAARDRAVRAALVVPVHSWWGGLVHPPGSVLTRRGTLSRVFKAFHRSWSEREWDPWPEQGVARVADEPAEECPRPDGDPPIPAGPAAAEQRLREFLRRLDSYGEDRERLDGAASGLSIDLKLGTLSPRHVLQVVGDTDEASAAFGRQLAWRDWFAHLLVESPQMVERAARVEYEAIPWEPDEAGFRAWCEGRTGYPVVDAAMRELVQTGSIANRTRMIAASFLVKHLLVDWRRGERWFRCWLTDADVAQNVGNWQWVAGMGPDAAPYFRVFNPVAQARRFDPDGTYVRSWVPELSRLPGRSVHAPWELGEEELRAAGVVLGSSYPWPIVDHTSARERALAVYRAVAAETRGGS